MDEVSHPIVPPTVYPQRTSCSSGTSTRHHVIALAVTSTTRDSPRTGAPSFSRTPTPGRTRSRARRFSECSGIPGTDTCCGKRTSARGPKTWGYDMSIAARFCLPVPPNPQQPSCHVSSRRLHHYIRRQRTRSTGDRSHHGMPALG